MTIFLHHPSPSQVVGAALDQEAFLRQAVGPPRPVLSPAALQPARAPDPPAVPVTLVVPALEPAQAVFGDMDTARAPGAPGGVARVAPAGVPARYHGYRECVQIMEALEFEYGRLVCEQVINGLTS